MVHFDRHSFQSAFFRWAGAAILLVSAMGLILNGLFFLRAESSVGEVVGLRSIEYGGGSRAPTVKSRLEPIVSFESADGKAVDFQASQRWTLGESSFSVGDTVSVLYLRDEPQKARLRSGSLFLVPLFFMVIGGAAIYAGEWWRS